MDAFVGVPQSKAAGLAILIAFGIAAVAILLGDPSMPFSFKFVAMLIVALMSVPSIAITLMNITCVVTGSGPNKKFWWCDVWGWILTGFIVFYSVLLVVAAVLVLMGQSSVADLYSKTEPGMAPEDALPLEVSNMMAQEFFANKSVWSPAPVAPASEFPPSQPVSLPPPTPIAPVASAPVPGPAPVPTPASGPAMPLAPVVASAGPDVPAPIEPVGSSAASVAEAFMHLSPAPLNMPPVTAPLAPTTGLDVFSMSGAPSPVPAGPEPFSGEGEESKYASF